VCFLSSPNVRASAFHLWDRGLRVASMWKESVNALLKGRKERQYWKMSSSTTARTFLQNIFAWNFLTSCRKVLSSHIYHTILLFVYKSVLQVNVLWNLHIQEILYLTYTGNLDFWILLPGREINFLGLVVGKDGFWWKCWGRWKTACLGEVQQF
jgi:hypothetical protein